MKCNTPFFVLGKDWVKVKDLKVGDQFFALKDKFEQVESIKRVKQKLDVYNIEVEGNHNYFITKAKILVHNK